jgi:UDP:flavonoid glycosyltransferase YjiC (YdhE family)
VVIHHAGFGTLATTALHAVPQLTLSRDADGPALAKRVARQGAGIALDPATATGEQVRHSVRRLLDEPGFAGRAGALRDEMLAMTAPNDVVGQLLEFAGGGR